MFGYVYIRGFKYVERFNRNDPGPDLLMGAGLTTTTIRVLPQGHSNKSKIEKGIHGSAISQKSYRMIDILPSMPSWPISMPRPSQLYSPLRASENYSPYF